MTELYQKWPKELKNDGLKQESKPIKKPSDIDKSKSKHEASVSDTLALFDRSSEW